MAKSPVVVEVEAATASVDGISARIRGIKAMAVAAVTEGGVMVVALGVAAATTTTMATVSILGILQKPSPC